MQAEQSILGSGDPHIKSHPIKPPVWALLTMDAPTCSVRTWNEPILTQRVIGQVYLRNTPEGRGHEAD